MAIIIGGILFFLTVLFYGALGGESDDVIPAFLIAIVSSVFFAGVFFLFAWLSGKKTTEHDDLLENKEWCEKNPRLYEKYKADKDRRDKEEYERKHGPAVTLSLQKNTLSYTGTIDNKSDKLINYVYVNIKGYDAVGTEVRTENFKFTGPLKAHSFSKVKFTRYWQDIGDVESFKVNELRVVFSDGTKQTIVDGKIVK